MSKLSGLSQLTDVASIGADILTAEAQCLVEAAGNLDERFTVAVETLFKCTGRIIVTGVGKSGHIGRKISATLASTGSPSFFVHAAEAGHGDLGMICEGDIVLALSHGGESEEVLNVVSYCKRFGVKVVGMCGRDNSSLARLSDIVLNTSISKEACPLGIAPTSSTTLQLALGDAVAMSLVSLRGFSQEDFARTHPLGRLGRHYYVKVADVMQDISHIPHPCPEVKLVEAIPDMAIGRMGAIVCLSNDTLVGIFTDSDLRRLITESGSKFVDLLDRPINDFLNHNPMTINIDQLARDALGIFESKRVSRLVCVDGHKVVGLLDWHNLLSHKIV